MKSRPDIVLYGTGHLAWTLGAALHAADYPIRAVWGRYRSDRDALARQLGAQSFASTAQLPAASLHLLALRDDAIPDFARELAPSIDRLLLHCAGAGSLDWLQPHPRRGILWPLQSLRKELTYDWQNIPLLVDANNTADQALLHELAAVLSTQVALANDAQRSAYHAAAVTTANFSNFLNEQAFQLLKQQGLDHRLLLPMLQFQLNGFTSDEAPLSRQTGPARRGDTATIEKHLQLLADRPAHAALYRLLSELIQKA